MLSTTRVPDRNDFLEFGQIALDVNGNPQSAFGSGELIKLFVRQCSRHYKLADLMGRSERKDREHDDGAEKRPERW
jgi:hypothetical protein